MVENVSLSFDKNKKINYLKISGEDCVTKNLSGEWKRWSAVLRWTERRNWSPIDVTQAGDMHSILRI